MNLLKNSKGMSLVSVMVAIGLTGVLSVILMKLSEQQASIQKKAMVDNDFNEAILHFRTVIMKKKSCDATVQGLKLGDTFTEVRYDYDSAKEAFATVSTESDFNSATKFRKGSKIILREMKILSKSEMKEAERPLDGNMIVLKVTFEKPSGTLGGNTIFKLFDIPAVIGKGDLATGDDKAIAVEDCEKSGGKIASWSTFEEVTGGDAEKQAAIVSHGSTNFGLCIKPGTSSGETMILGCSTSE
jgi:hypothetical protein